MARTRRVALLVQTGLMERAPARHVGRLSVCMHVRQIQVKDIHCIPDGAKVSRFHIAMGDADAIKKRAQARYVAKKVAAVVPAHWAAELCCCDREIAKINVLQLSDLIGIVALPFLLFYVREHARFVEEGISLVHPRPNCV